MCEFDFEELWASGNIASTGVHDDGSVAVTGANVDVAFAPVEGPTIDADLAALVSTPKTRMKVASMVMSSHMILGAPNDAIEAGIGVSGMYDRTQMAGILKAWNKSGIPRLRPSKHYTKTGLHNKVLAVDETFATGSFNLSTNATRNAEDSLLVHSVELADQKVAVDCGFG